MATPLRASGLCKQFGGLQVLDHMNVDIERGDVVALIGPNGAGKSTLIGCVCGSVIPDAGTVTIGGFSLVESPLQARARLRYLAQEVDVPEGVSGRELLQFFADVYGPHANLALMVERSGLGNALDRLASTYSVGMRRRLVFAAATAGNPDLLVLDEPFAGVDREGREQMLARIVELTHAGVGVLVAAHDRDLLDLERLRPRRLELQHHAPHES